ncbi:hypothetical protein KIPE111705_44240 [Kibdelosporangium persicum]|uniref:Uncharacterized protein n=1 Tax=Kibdelosporangium persicum TaxID=2698649 RepID=A0ABX2EZU7_9PSEU|nr:hypothetical protein [Kibdelosporangium persicum]NRN64527.1 hypothetical protein [Kibdelosporangium persicum]
MTYGPPPNQGWQQPPPPPPGWGPPIRGPRKPPLPGLVVTLGILAIVFGLLSGGVQGPADITAFVIKVLVGLMALVGGIMVLNRARAGAVLLTISGGLNTLVFALSFFTSLGRAPRFTRLFSLFNDGLPLLHALLGIAVLVLSLLPQVTKALSQPGPPRPPGPPPGPPPGYGPQQPPGFGPHPGHGPPFQQPPPPSRR